jgi:hypothetical protein
MACAVAGVLNKKEGKPLPTDDPELETLFFASPNQITAFADLAFTAFAATGEIKADKKKFVKACRDVGVHDAADIALFGRMVAADSSLTLEGPPTRRGRRGGADFGIRHAVQPPLRSACHPS